MLALDWLWSRVAEAGAAVVTDHGLYTWNEDSEAMRESSDDDLLQWVSDVEDRLGGRVDDFHAAVLDYCIARAGGIPVFARALFPAQGGRMTIPASVEFMLAFNAAFANVVADSYPQLRAVEDNPHDTVRDPGDVRCDFSNAIGDAAEECGILYYSAEDAGELSDMLADSWRGLFRYFELTTEQG